MSKTNKSHKKGLATSTKEKRKTAKKQAYASMRESSKGTETSFDPDVKATRGRMSTGSTRYCTHPRRGERRANAIESRMAWNTLTPIQQLSHLNEKLGFNRGATKQRARLLKEISYANP